MIIFYINYLYFISIDFFIYHYVLYIYINFFIILIIIIILLLLFIKDYVIVYNKLFPSFLIFFYIKKKGIINYINFLF